MLMALMRSQGSKSILLPPITETVDRVSVEHPVGLTIQGEDRNFSQSALTEYSYNASAIIVLLANTRTVLAGSPDLLPSSLLLLLLLLLLLRFQ